MEKDDCDRKKYKKFKITTPQGNVEINYPNDQRPGFCPYCNKCIPSSSIVLKKEDEGSAGYTERIGECPYCHKPIPVIEIIFKKADE